MSRESSVVSRTSVLSSESIAESLPAAPVEKSKSKKPAADKSQAAPAPKLQLKKLSFLDFFRPSTASAAKTKAPEQDAPSAASKAKTRAVSAVTAKTAPLPSRRGSLQMDTPLSAHIEKSLHEHSDEDIGRKQQGRPQSLRQSLEFSHSDISERDKLSQDSASELMAGIGGRVFSITQAINEGHNEGQAQESDDVATELSTKSKASFSKSNLVNEQKRLRKSIQGTALDNLMTQAASQKNPRKNIGKTSTKNWTTLRNSLRFAYLANRAAKQLTKKMLLALKEPPRTDEKTGGKPETLMSVYESLTVDKNGPHTIAVRNLCDIAPPNRTESDIERLDRLVYDHVPSYAMYSKTERLHLSKHFRLISIAAGSLVLWQGHRTTSFHFILRGRCEVFTTTNHIKKWICNKKTGEALDELFIEKGYGTRPESVLALTDMLILTLEVQDYLKLDRTGVGRHPKLANLSKLSIFTDQSSELFQNASKYMDVMEFKENEFILNEGDYNNFLFFIIQGTCSILRTVTFTKTPLGKYVKRVASDEVPKGSSIVDMRLQTQVLGVGEYFPNLPKLHIHQGLDSLLSAEFSKNLKASYCEFYSSLANEKANSLATILPYSVKAETYCVVASISYFELVSLVNDELMFKMLRQFPVAVPNQETLEEHFLQEKDWETFKKEIVQKPLKD
ncbi:hypothetical protein HDU91_002476 [Kappamyces sp. JEL0680]|nr:hypothetical protein HDU91_002476 [Kappamyces sp. JEL0680]